MHRSLIAFDLVPGTLHCIDQLLTISGAPMFARPLAAPTYYPRRRLRVRAHCAESRRKSNVGREEKPL
jgi:hypothetical protein